MTLQLSAQRTHTVATIVKLKDWNERPESSQSAQALLKKFSGQLMGTSQGFSICCYSTCNYGYECYRWI